LALRQSRRIAGFFDLHKYSLHTLHARELFERSNNITPRDSNNSISIIGGVNQS